MVSYDLQASGGDPRTATDYMMIYQYPNDWDDDGEVQNAMLAALENMCEQLYQANAIGYYEISWTQDHPYITASDKSGFLDEFHNDYLPSINPPKGSHLLVSNSLWEGKAKLGDNGSTVFNDNWLSAVMGTSNAEQFWQNGGIQEVMHNFLDYTKFPSTFSEDHGGGHEHHDLGKLYSGYLDPASPMASGYEGTHANHGKCDDSVEGDDVYHQDLTYCAKEAIDQTSDAY